MFGCVVAGRPFQTNLQQVDETHALFELPQAHSINHVCVFLLGTVPFPDGYGAGVHFFWPGKGFQFLGMLSNEKPSAIFRLRGTFTTTPTASQTAQTAFASTASTGQNPNDVTAVLGFAIEPLESLQAQASTLQSSSANSSSSTALVPELAKDPTFLAERVVKHLFNYISSFIGGSVTPDVMVPMSIIAKWYESFLGKVRAGGVGFLERGD